MISLIVTIIVLGLIAYAVTLLPIPEPFKNIINVILILVAVFALLSALGVNVPFLRLR